MTPKVIYKDSDGKRRRKAVKCSIFADPNEVIREFCKANRMPLSTYIYQVQEGAQIYIWHGLATDAFDEEQLKNF